MFGKRRTYLDYASGVHANPSSPHTEGRKAKKMLEEARTAIARLVEVQGDDVIFTSGATEANALAILGRVRALTTAGMKNIHILYLPSAHASIIENVEILRKEGISVEPLPIVDYRVDIERLTKMLQAQTALITMEAVCGETGVVWNTREVAETLRAHNSERLFAPHGERTLSALLHVDASQAPLTEKIPRAHFGADLLTFDASKVGVPRGSGTLIAHRTIPLLPLYGGGGQERGVRSGSQMPELAEKFAAALQKAAGSHDSFRENAVKLRQRLIERIIPAIPNVYINGAEHPTPQQAPHILNLSLSNRDTDYLLTLLDEAGFAVSSRSACETDSETGSRAVYALTGDRARALSTLRISWGPAISQNDLDRFARALCATIGFIDNAAHR
jgi:cysteine desulfurase